MNSNETKDKLLAEKRAVDARSDEIKAELERYLLICQGQGKPPNSTVVSGIRAERNELKMKGQALQVAIGRIRRGNDLSHHFRQAARTRLSHKEFQEILDMAKNLLKEEEDQCISRD